MGRCTSMHLTQVHPVRARGHQYADRHPPSLLDAPVTATRTAMQVQRIHDGGETSTRMTLILATLATTGIQTSSLNHQRFYKVRIHNVTIHILLDVYMQAAFIPLTNIYPLLHFETVPTEPEIKNSPSFPVRSIPYSSYLKRYSVSASHSSFHRNPYMPPPRVLFSQSKVWLISLFEGM